MKIDHLSASSVEKFSQCPARLFRGKELKDRPYSVNLEFGTLIHEVLEEYHQKDNVFSLDRLFDDFWAKSNLTELEYYKIGKQIVDSYDNNFIDSGDVIANEKEFIIEISGNEFYGKIDKIIHIGNGLYEIVDYKTSNYMKTKDELDNDTQLSVYDIAVRNMYKENDEIFEGLEEPEEIILTIYYLKHGEKSSTSRTEEQRDLFWDYIYAISTQIEEMEEPVEKLNKFCPYCDVRTTCKAYNNAHNVDTLTSPKSIEEALQALSEIKIAISLLYKQKDAVEAFLYPELEASTNGSVTDGRYVASLKQKRDTLIDTAGLSAVWPNIVKKYKTLDVSQLKKDIKKDPELAEKLKDFTKVNASKPWIEIGEVK